MEFQLSIIDEMIGRNIQSKEFLEFSDNIDALIEMADTDVYLTEALSDPGTKMKRSRQKIVHNTASTIRSTAGAYGDITDVGGGILKTAWNTMMRAISLAARILSFLINKIAAIPKAISKLGMKISRIPDQLKKKIRGDIDLNITVGDIESMYNQAVIKRIDSFIADARTISQGDVWKCMFNPKGKLTQKINFTGNEMAICRRMEKTYNALRLIKFNPTRIRMDDPANIEMYFGNSQSVKFTDMKGKQHACSYHEALTWLMNDINGRKDILEELHKDLGAKLDATQMNQSFSNLGPAAQKRVMTTLQMMSRIVSVVGDIVRSIMTDVNTIDKSCDKILAKRGIK